MDEAKVIGAIAGAAASAGSGSVTVATVTTSAPGILGMLGFATTTTVALPVGGVVAVAALVGYDLYKGVKIAKEKH
ncbi:MAG TPA: hypothetical protein IGS17_14395 [Oscillatoriales cyanobacterium M59_W2019_021]|nr:hypothetical protein [Oscillatoriales cyanobacterium M4454_W2019_049]HIK52093.1 hypothetical protein [Oscillatoriales cyanobacterium M59_W2019_021]